MLTALRPVLAASSVKRPAGTPAATRAATSARMLAATSARMLDAAPAEMLDASAVATSSARPASGRSEPRSEPSLGGRARRWWNRRHPSVDAGRAGAVARAAREAELAAHLFRAGLHHLR